MQFFAAALVFADCPGAPAHDVFPTGDFRLFSVCTVLDMVADGSFDPAPGFRMAPTADDWAVARRSRANVLVTGPRPATDALIVALTRSLREPIARFNCDTALRLPAGGGTVVLADVDALDGPQQEMLLRWMNASVSTPRVISLTTTPLYPRVQADSFSSALYYRINVICLEVMCV